MLHVHVRRSMRRAFLFWAPVSVVIGCKNSNGGTGANPTIALSVNPGSGTVVQGGSTTATGTLTRSGGYTDLVTFTVTGAPSGASATVGNLQTNGAVSTATITIQVGAATPVSGGTPYTIVVTGKGSGVSDAPASYSLTVTAAPDFSLGVTPSSITLVQGNSKNDIAVTITRTNFTDAVTLSLIAGTSAIPAGVTASFAPAAPTSTTSTMTLNVGPAVTPGTYNLQVSGTGTAGTHNAPLTLIVTAAGSFTLGITPAPATLSLQQGNADNSKSVTITRTSYAPAITLAAEIAPVPTAGTLAATFTPNPVSGNSAVLSLTASATLTPATYTVTVRGTGPAALRATGGSAAIEATTTLSVTVTQAPPAGSATVSFAGCNAADKPVWLAYQNGATAAWVVATPVADAYQFTINQPKGGVAWVTTGAQTSVNVQYYTQAEITAATLRYCSAPVAGETINGSFAGVDVGSNANASFGGATASGVTNGPFQLTNAKDGLFDVVGYLKFGTIIAPDDRVYLNRGLNPANGGSVGTVDFSLTEVRAFSPVFPTASVSGTVAGETIFQSMTFYTGTGATACTPAPLYFGSPFVSNNTSTAFIPYGVPIGKQIAGDMHRILISTSAGTAPTTSVRTVSESFADLVARAATPFLLPQSLPLPTVTNLGGPSKRLKADVSGVPVEFGSSATFVYSTASKSVLVSATYGWLGGFNFSLSLPDFVGLAGWNTTWPPASGDPVNWSLTASGISGSSLCTPPSRHVSATRSGTA